MSETIDKRMADLAARIATAAVRAIERHPANVSSIVELAMSGATSLEFGRRVLVAYGDIGAAEFASNMAELVLNSLNGLLQNEVQL